MFRWLNDLITRTYSKMINLRKLMWTTLLLLISGSLLKSQDCNLQLKSCNTNFNFGDTCVQQLMKPYFEKNRLILCGELHYYEKNWLIKSNLAKTLNTYYGVNRMFVEYPVSYENLYNNYLLYGDERILRNLPYLTQDTLNERLFLQEMRAYNLLRPDSLRVQVICVDMEKNASTAIQELHALIFWRKPRVFRKSTGILDQYIESQSMTIERVKSTVKILYHEFYRHQKQFKRRLSATDYSKYKHIIDGLNLGFMFDYTMDEKGTNEPSYVMREKFLLANVSEVLQLYPDEKFFGSFGLSHCLLNNNQQQFWGITTTAFAFELNTDRFSPVLNNVCSIVQYYSYYDDSLYLNNFLGQQRACFLTDSSSLFSIFENCDLTQNRTDVADHGQLLIVNRNIRGPFVK